MNHDKPLTAKPDRGIDAAGPSRTRHPAVAREGADREWQGHLPATQAALEQILMRACLGNDDFSLAERVFAQACELRSRVATRSWTMHVGTSRRELEMGRYILLALGAERLSEDIARTSEEVKAAVSRHRQSAMLRHLERRLAAQGNTLDVLLARYAERLWSCPESPDGST